MSAEEWAAIYTAAAGAKAVAGDLPAIGGIIGRSITYIVHTLVLFWGKHKSDLVRYFTTAAIAAMEAVVANEADILRINPPGPQ